MIQLTVRTLDSQNHSFTVEDDITVIQFKEKIADTVNIPAEIQRIIYCGRVLNDNSKLNEYDVNGKVVHLVQRAPPSESNQRDAASNFSPPSQRVIGGNAMYLGSMAIPQNLDPPPPSHSLAASRLNVARRMLRRAEMVINQLENPTVRSSDITPTDEPPEDVTPVFEARVIVPASGNDTIDETFVLNAVQNTLINAGSTSTNIQLEQQTETVPEVSQPAPEQNNESEPVRSASSTPEGVSPISTSTEDLAGTDTTSNAPRSNNTLAENASSTVEMADLLETLGRLQVRFAPFLETYQNFMREDPNVPQENVRRTQAMMNRVSEVLHFLGHAYHSLSDIIIRVRDVPSRPLLCRPILIQHSAILQAGFPIQVEAQINISPESNTTTSTTTASTNTTTTESSTATTATPASATTNTTSNQTNVNSRPPSWHAYLPEMSALSSSGFQVQSFPLGLGGLGGLRSAMSGANRNTTTSTTNSNANSSTFNPFVRNGGTSGNASGNSPDVEIFMEVIPESISLETTLLAAGQGGQTEEVRTAPPPELLQSFLQMASHIVNRGAGRSNTNGNSQTTPTTSNTTASQPQSEASQNSTSGQNSQARGNTQTNPTTSTHTRSTPRPHVHLAQHAMQGFDPFLPCNSHHVGHRRRAQVRNITVTNNNQLPNGNARSQNGNTNVNNQFNPVINIVQEVVNSIQNMYTRRNIPVNIGVTPATTVASENAATPIRGGILDLSQIFPPVAASVLQGTPSFNANGANARVPTIAQLMQQAGDQTEGEGIFSDLIMFLSRHFTINDMIQLNSGRLDALMRIRADLRTFVINRVLEGDTNVSNVERAVSRCLTELQPLLEHLNQLEVREDIDIVRSLQTLLRMRLPNVINLAISRTPNSIRTLVEQCKIIFRHTCALIVYSSSNGLRGVEEILGSIRRYMDGINPDVQQWTLNASRLHLQQYVQQLVVPNSVLQPYIVRKLDSVVNGTEPQPMELDADDVAETQASGSNGVLGVLSLEDEELPSVMLGSEPWHAQVPSDWVPIITRDSQRQRRQNQRSPLSDAYLSGMPNKRRKIVSSCKPQGSLPQVITDGLRRAVTATGLSTVANLDEVVQEAGADASIQSAYRELLRSRVQSSVKDNEDFTPDRFPNASSYFNKAP